MFRSNATLATATFITGSALADVPHRLSGWASRESVSPSGFHSIEGVLPLGASTLGVAIDNNYPGDSGRRAGVPDDMEVIRIEFEQPLSTLSTVP